MHPDAAKLMDQLTPGGPRKRAARRLPLGLARIDPVLGGGLLTGALHEVRAPTARDIGPATGMVLSLLARLLEQRVSDQADTGRVLWITDPAVVPDAGFLYPQGLAQYGIDPAALTLVNPVDVKTALWAADEGARCTDLAAVVLHLHGNPARLDRVATRRLMLRAQSSGVTVLLLRQSGAEEAGAAQTRWRAVPHPSPPDPDYAPGIGQPQYRLKLERSRTGQTGEWPVIWTPSRRAFDHGHTRQEIAPSGPTPSGPTQDREPKDRPADPLGGLPLSGQRPDRPRPMGQVVDIGRPRP